MSLAIRYDWLRASNSCDFLTTTIWGRRPDAKATSRSTSSSNIADEA